MKTSVRIGTAEHLLGALCGADEAVARAVQRTIRADPARALAFGAHEGVDVIDALIALSEPGNGMRSLTALSTLSVFNEQRVVDFFIHTLSSGTGMKLEASVAYLQFQLPAFERAQIFPALMQNASLRRARAAGRLLQRGLPVDPPEVRLRMALLDAKAELPAYDEALFMVELDGVVAGEARAAIESLTAPTALLAARDRLSGETREWLLRWSTRVAPVESLDFLLEALEDERLLDAALDCLPTARTAAIDAALDRLSQRARRSVRLKAVRCGGGDLSTLMHDEDADVRAAVLSRQEVADDVLVRGLADVDWRIRAAASDALVDRGARMIDAVRPLALDARTEVKSAAVQVLMALGDDLWLEEALITP